MNKNLMQPISNLQALKQQVLLSLLSGLSPQPGENTHVINNSNTSTEVQPLHLWLKKNTHKKSVCSYDSGLKRTHLTLSNSGMSEWK